MAHFLITGGAGFIGSHIACTLVDLGHKVSIIDNLSTGCKDNLESCFSSIRFFEGDIRYPKDLAQVLPGVDFVLHQAALPSVPRSIEDPQITNSNNINGTLTLLIAARDAGVKRFVYASSSSVYGYNPVTPKKETQTPQPRSPYALSKLTGEYYCNLFHEIYGFETVCLRYFNVFGSRQNPKSQYAAVVPRFIVSLLSKNTPVIYSDGQQSRDFTHIDNISNANINACTAPNAAGKTFNIGCGIQTSINDLYNIIQQLTATDIQPEYQQARKGDVLHSVADISQAKQFLKYQPIIDLNEGLKLTIDYYRELAG